MKKLISSLINRFYSEKRESKRTFEFLIDSDTIRHAAEGSMQKRIDLIERVKLTHRI